MYAVLLGGACVGIRSSIAETRTLMLREALELDTSYGCTDIFSVCDQNGIVIYTSRAYELLPQDRKLVLDGFVYRLGQRLEFTFKTAHNTFDDAGRIIWLAKSAYVDRGIMVTDRGHIISCCEILGMDPFYYIPSADERVC